MSPEPEKRSDEHATIVSVPSSRDDALALLAEWRCCGAPNICGARCMDDEESHRLAQFAAFIDNEEVNNSGLRAALAASRAEVEALRASLRYATDENERLTRRAEQDSRGLDRWCHYQDRLYGQMTAAEIEEFEARLGEDGWTNEPLCRHEAALAAARVEVSQLRAKIEAVAHAIEEDAQPEPEWHADSQGESIRGSALRWAARVVRAALAEPLGSTPEQEQAK